MTNNTKTILKRTSKVITFEDNGDTANIIYEEVIGANFTDYIENPLEKELDESRKFITIEDIVYDIVNQNEDSPFIFVKENDENNPYTNVYNIVENWVKDRINENYGVFIVADVNYNEFLENIKNTFINFTLEKIEDFDEAFNAFKVIIKE